jgi:hypothetical protein
MAWPNSIVLSDYALASAWPLCHFRRLSSTESLPYHSTTLPKTQRLPSACSGQDSGSTPLSKFGEEKMVHPLTTELTH